DGNVRSGGDGGLQRGLRAARNDHIGFEANEVGDIGSVATKVLLGRSDIEDEIAPLAKAAFLQFLDEGPIARSCNRAGTSCCEEADARRLVALLRMRGERPRRR